MRRYMLMLAVGAVCALAAVANAQRRSVIPQDKGPKGEAKLRWVCERLSLNDEQAEYAEGLIDQYLAECEEEKADGGLAIVKKIQQLFAERQRALSDGDTEKANQINAEIRDAAPGVQPEKRFFAALEPLLTDGQNAKVVGLREQVRNAPAENAPANPPAQPPAQPPKPVQQPPRPAQPPPPTAEAQPTTETPVELRPIHVLRAVLGLPLAADQLRQVEESLAGFRESVAKSRPRSEGGRADKVEELINLIGPLLTPEQNRTFEQKIAKLRTDAPAARPIEIPRPPRRAPRERPTSPHQPTDRAPD